MKWDWLYTQLPENPGPRRPSGWRDVHCPAHADTCPSLGVKTDEADDDVLAVKCQKGCTRAQILAKWGVRPDALKRSGRWGQNADGSPREFEDCYDYTDESGVLLRQVVRLSNPKGFRQRRPNPTKKSGWSWEVGGVRQVLYRLPDLQGETLVFVVEGEKDQHTLADDFGLVATTNAEGTRKWRDEYVTQLVAAGVKTVVCLPDHDPAGAAHMRTVAQSCLAAGLTVKIVDLPGLPPKGDVSDWVASGGTHEALLNLVECAPTVTAEDVAPDILRVDPADRRPAFEVLSDFDAHHYAGELWKTIIDVNHPPSLFRFGDTLVWIERDTNERPFARTLNTSRLAHWCTARIRFWRTERDQQKPTDHVPLLTDLLITPEPPVPVLHRIIRTPVLTPDGDVHLLPGYDGRSHAYYVPVDGFTLDPVSTAPTAAEIRTARELIEEVYCDFPFVGQPDRANAAAALLTIFLRDLIDGPTPLFLLQKPTMGTGATLFVEAIVGLATGRVPSAGGQGEDDAEWKKKITAALLEAPDVIFFDNLGGRLDSDALCRALSARVWQERILGKSQEVHLPIACTWFGSANNLSMSTQVARRIVPINIDAQCERPWLRTRDGVVFTHPDLLGWVLAERPRLVRAALTLCRAWVAEGRPLVSGPAWLGMFEQWMGVLGGVLTVAGISEFLGNLDAFYEEADTDTDEAKPFLVQWWFAFRDARVTPTELYQRLLTGPTPSVELPLEGRDDGGRVKSLGWYLRRLKNRHFDLGPFDISTPAPDARIPGV